MPQAFRLAQFHTIVEFFIRKQKQGHPRTQHCHGAKGIVSVKISIGLKYSATYPQTKSYTLIIKVYSVEVKDKIVPKGFSSNGK